jgi:WD40 repeat protein
VSTADRGAGDSPVGASASATDEHPTIAFAHMIPLDVEAPIVALAVGTNWIAASYADVRRDTVVFSLRGEQLAALPGIPHARLVASPSGRLLATFSPSAPLEAYVWRMPEGGDTRPTTCMLPPAAQAVSAVAWHPGQEEYTLYVGTASGAIYRWHRNQEQEPPERILLRKLTTDGVPVTALMASPQGAWLAVGSANGVLGTVALDGSAREMVYPGRHTSGVGGLYVARGWFIVSQAQSEPVCRVWNPANTSPWVREWRIIGEDERMPSAGQIPVALDPQERWAYSAATLERIQVWRYWRWPPQDRLPTLSAPGMSSADRGVRITALAVGVGGALLAAGDERGRVWLWRVGATGTAG